MRDATDAAGAWAQIPEWLPYTGYPANWNAWAAAAYGAADLRSGPMAAAILPPGPPYSRSTTGMGPTPHAGHHAGQQQQQHQHPAALTAMSLNAGGGSSTRSPHARSLWTPNGGGVSSSINGPTSGPGVGGSSHPGGADGKGSRSAAGGGGYRRHHRNSEPGNSSTAVSMKSAFGEGRV